MLKRFSFLNKVPVTPVDDPIVMEPVVSLDQDTAFVVSNSDADDIVEALTCVVCFDVMSKPVALSCGHSLCRDCWKDWNERNPITATCPVCRRAFPVELVSFSILMRNMVHTMVATQPCGARVTLGTRVEHEKSCETCMAIPAIRERVHDSKHTHVVYPTIAAQRKDEVRQVADLIQRKGREWQTNEQSSRARRYAVVRMQQAIKAARGGGVYIPEVVFEWERRNKTSHTFKIELPMDVRRWLDETEIFFD